MKKFLTVVLCSLVSVGILIVPTFADSFPDVDKDASYAEAVEFLNDAGIMMGDDKGNFNPNHTVTRAEMATIICRMLGETDLVTSNVFSDVPTTHWANKYIAKSAEMGIVNGYGNGKFGPEDAVTYAQAITMVVRAMDLEDYAVKAGGYPNGYISIAVDKGLAGSFTSSPEEFLARWQIADIIFGSYSS